MIQVIRSGKRFKHQDRDLTTYWSFSFDYYRDPDNVNFGRLRVFNDDTLRPRAGFPTHSHRDMEIVTYVLQGALAHKDSMGNEEVIPAGHVQKMSAGTGINHSEFNASKSETVHLLQVWVMPEREGLEPSYSTPQVQPAREEREILDVVTPDGRDGTASIDADVTFTVIRLPSAATWDRKLDSNRLAHLFLIDGDLEANGTLLSPGDAARIRGEGSLALHAGERTHALLIDLPPEG